MPFPGYLLPNQISDLIQYAIAAEFVTAGREVYLRNIFKPFALGMRNAASLLDQFELDLNKLNETERLADGQVPMVQFLQNAADYLRRRGRPEGDYFAQLANEIGNRTGGVFKLPDPTQLPEIKRNEAIIGLDEMVDFAFLEGGLLAGASVARLIVPRFESKAAIQTETGAPWVMAGTGWLIAPRLLVTNWHVINCRKDGEPEATRRASVDDLNEQAFNTTAEFDFETNRRDIVTIRVDSVVAFSETLDYALLRLRADPARAPLSLRRDRLVFTAATYLPVNIVQHPRGEKKRLAMRNNLVTGADGDVIRYVTDTDFGSSGSPVCDDSWRVLALHRGAEFLTGLKVNGKSSGYVNYGTQIPAICDDLEKRAPGLHSEIVGLSSR